MQIHFTLVFGQVMGSRLSLFWEYFQEILIMCIYTLHFIEILRKCLDIVIGLTGSLAMILTQMPVVII